MASGAIEPGSVWFAIACGVLLVVPLALGSGVTAGCAYLLSVAVGLLGNVVLRRSAFSWLPWAAAYGLLPAFLSYGGWGGQRRGRPADLVMTVLAALLGVAVHVLLALPDLVDDNADGLRHLPLRLALRTGAPRLLRDHDRGDGVPGGVGRGGGPDGRPAPVARMARSGARLADR